MSNIPVPSTSKRTSSDMANQISKKTKSKINRTKNKLEIVKDTNEDSYNNEETEKVLVMVCQYKDTPTSPSCGTTYIRKDSSTGNAISHLRSKHDINFSNNETVFDDNNTNEEAKNPNTPLNCNGLIDTIQETLNMAMDHYWKDLTAPQSLLPSILDPRIKNLILVNLKKPQIAVFNEVSEYLKLEEIDFE
ncbi:7274_t:CDS:2, partial [Racocetra fulgida]